MTKQQLETVTGRLAEIEQRLRALEKRQADAKTKRAATAVAKQFARVTRTNRKQT